ncbi:hypothetical protein M9H77_12588 [Catharanthus roseus]|uniref:Uncharacterized protein n=1 Tax=Catharanthus roseus TaxID=4058 RepID=A0ACC0BHV2_CATRO|nr:hypothetical protein M9H77_12588 [Catharanthus roseus]
MEFQDLFAGGTETSSKIVDWDGYDIPKKTRVTINAWAIARDEEYWIDPNSFIPERFENNNNINSIDFSGRRICPGIAFGLANIELPLALLLYYFNWKLPYGLEPNDLDMTETSGLTTSRKSDFLLIPTIYDHSFDMSGILS